MTNLSQFACELKNFLSMSEDHTDMEVDIRGLKEKMVGFEQSSAAESENIKTAKNIIHHYYAAEQTDSNTIDRFYYYLNYCTRQETRLMRLSEDLSECFARREGGPGSRLQVGGLTLELEKIYSPPREYPSIQFLEPLILDNGAVLATIRTYNRLAATYNRLAVIDFETGIRFTDIAQGDPIISKVRNGDGYYLLNSDGDKVYETDESLNIRRVIDVSRFGGTGSRAVLYGFRRNFVLIIKKQKKVVFLSPGLEKIAEFAFPHADWLQTAATYRDRLLLLNTPLWSVGQGEILQVSETGEGLSLYGRLDAPTGLDAKDDHVFASDKQGAHFLTLDGLTVKQASVLPNRVLQKMLGMKKDVFVQRVKVSGHRLYLFVGLFIKGVSNSMREHIIKFRMTGKN